jgi:hypothetical protein
MCYLRVARVPWLEWKQWAGSWSRLPCLPVAPPTTGWPRRRRQLLHRGPPRHSRRRLTGRWSKCPTTRRDTCSCCQSQSARPFWFFSARGGQGRAEQRETRRCSKAEKRAAPLTREHLLSGAPGSRHVRQGREENSWPWQHRQSITALACT